MELIIAEPDFDKLQKILKEVETITTPENHKHLIVLLTIKDLN